MDGKTCIITGATSGIGKAAALELAKMGAHLAIVGRSAEKGAATIAEIQRVAKFPDEVRFFQADFEDLGEVRRVGTELAAAYKRIDVLINNAGAIFLSREESKDGFEKTMAVNHLAPFVLTGILLETLKESAPARIVNTASGAHIGQKMDFDNLQLTTGYKTFTAYGRSKLYNILFTRQLAKKLEGTGVTVTCMHPGFVASGFATNNGWFARQVMALSKFVALTPEQGADTLVYLASSSDVEGESGGYYAKRQVKTPSAEALDDANAEGLWEVSEELSGFRYA